MLKTKKSEKAAASKKKAKTLKAKAPKVKKQKAPQAAKVKKEKAPKKPGALMRLIRSTYFGSVNNTVDATEKKRFPLFIVCGAAITTALFMVIVSSFMQISQIQADISEMNATIRQLEAKERKLGMELEGRYSSKIESLAEDMGLSGKRPITYSINANENSETEEIVEKEEKDSTINSLMSAFSRSFKKFMEFID